METVPLGSLDDSVKPTHIRCNSPIWPIAEEVQLDISLNGADYLGAFAFTFYDGIDLYRIAPMAGPNEGHTRVKLFGTGFNGGQNREDVHVKWGVVSTAKVEKDQVLDYIW